MSFQLNVAVRAKSKLRVGLFGPSGSGKTMSALRLAKGITGDWSKIALVDTERGSGALYANSTHKDPFTKQEFEVGKYLHGRVDAPFTPEKYIEAIRFCESAGAEVIIIDSISHEWDGRGGILDIHAALPGNSFANWAKVTPRHNAFIDSILESNAHVICCGRSKQEYVLSEQSRNGKNVQVPEKVGMKAITRDGFDYELTLAFDLDIRHNALSSKDRTSLFADKPEFVINDETGKQLIAWMDTGVDEVDRRELIVQRNALIKTMGKIATDYNLDPDQLREITGIETLKDPSLTVPDLESASQKLMEYCMDRDVSNAVGEPEPAGLTKTEE